MEELRMDTTRRSFLGLLAGAAAGLVLSARRLAFAATRVSLPLADAPELATVGGVKAARLGGRDLVLVRESAAAVKALDGRCTHQGCLVAYDRSARLLACPCHGSGFRLNGKVAKGPASSSLAAYPATLSGNVIFVDLP
jgi:nitrite reductase/ring-hydroxylating ferredoxin subunit